MKLFWTFSFVFLAYWLPAQGFSRVLEKPFNFVKPINNSKYHLASSKPVVKGLPWIVVCDRSEQNLSLTFRKPDLTSGMFSRMEWLATYFVVEEEAEWIHIVKGKLKSGLTLTEETKDYGWVPKENILLWTDGLRDAQTGIHLKALLLNKASEIDRIIKLRNKEVVPMYKGPETDQTIGEKLIYEFYFVLKRENGRYLLCKNDFISAYNSDDIVGWVEDHRINDWNTRIAFEPNFEAGALAERKAKTQFVVKGFTTEKAARDCVENNLIDEKAVVWKNDPAVLLPSKLAKTDVGRFKGAVVRFPLLLNFRNYFKSGLVGDITTKNIEGLKSGYIAQVNHGAMVQDYQSMEYARNNMNVFFLLEGTNSVANLVPSICAAISNLKALTTDIVNLKVGIGIYRDLPEDKEGRGYKILPLTSDYGKAEAFVKSTEFGRWYDNDDYTSLNNGLYQSILEAGFNESQTNIICVVGNYADFSQSLVRRTDAQEKGLKMVSRDQIEKLLSKIGAHLLFIQGKSEDSDASEKFGAQGRSFILESAKLQFDEYRKVTKSIPEIKVQNPDIGSLDESNAVSLENGPRLGMVVKPTLYKSLGPAEVSALVDSFVMKVVGFNVLLSKALSKMIEDGASFSDISAGEFTPAIAQVLQKYMDKRNVSWNDEDVQKLVHDKYKLYQEVYIPKKLPGARYESLSYVLFMPQNDLIDYVRQMKLLKKSLGETDDVRRESLFNFLIKLLEDYSGNKSISKNLQNLTTQDIRELMQGLKKEGVGGNLVNFSLTGKDDFQIADIKSKKDISDEQILNFINTLVKKVNVLDDILEQGADYEFSYRSQKNLYYWIPLSYTF